MLEKQIKELEKLGKPILMVLDYDVYVDSKTTYEILFLTKNHTEYRSYIGTNTAEEKDGILITDDFIFIKELL